MKIYFVGSISGREKYLKNYQAIIRKLKKLDHEVIENTISPKKEWVYSLTDKQKVEYYKQVLDWINGVDVVVAESSYSSISVGHEISVALEKEKPVIVLYKEGEASHFLRGIDSEKVQVIKYDDKDLGPILEQAINKASFQADTRFNFFISPRIVNYLDWIAKKKRIPRAVYLRRLIEKDMKRSEE
jgi:hypothetical protein